MTKAYVTRVGEGPFPTEIYDGAGEVLRARGQEFGAVTGRPRRCGWLDLPLLRYSNQINGTEWLVITKLDVLDELDWIPVCTAYEVDGKPCETMPADIRGHRGDPARVHSAEGMEDVDGGDSELRRTSESGAGVSALHGNANRARRSASFRPDRIGTRRSRCRNSARRCGRIAGN